MNISCEIHSFGAFTPEERISNHDLEKMVDTSDEWIVERTGIRERRKVAPEDNTSDLALRASLLALDQINLPPSSLTHIIVSTCTPDQLAPSVACVIAGEIGASNIMAFDIGAACTGFIFGLSICRAILAAEPASRILFTCAEALTRRINWADRDTCIIFGDAAVATVITGGGPDRICSLRDVICRSNGEQKDLIIVGGGTACKYEAGMPVDETFFISMQGRETYKLAVRQMASVCMELLERNGLSVNDIDIFIPHQANIRIIEAVGSRLGIAPEKVFANVASFGNTAAASVPLALAEARAQGRIAPGARVLISAFGAGLTWGAALLDF